MRSVADSVPYPLLQFFSITRKAQRNCQLSHTTMASASPTALPAFLSSRSPVRAGRSSLAGCSPRSVAGGLQMWKKGRSTTAVSAVGEVSSEGTTYLIAGAAVVALLGTAFPLIFSRKDTCPECDGAGFVRKAGATLRANAARKDQSQIVCQRCNGLGKLGQIDK